jgi:universal stress protein E
LRIPDWELLRLSPMPVLVVKGRRAYRQPVVLAALDPTHAFAKPARLDEEILRIGETVAGGLHGKLHALHAYSPIPEELPPEIWSAADVTAAVTSRARAAAKVGLDRSLKGRSIPRARRHLVGTHPVNAIPDVARRTKAAIVVMGAISRSGIRSLFIGNTAERVLDALECDLLVVKPRGCVNRVPRAKRGMRLAMSAPISW